MINRGLITPDLLQDIWSAKGYAWYSKGDLNLNIFGIRSNETRAGEFDDLLGVFYYLRGQSHLRLWPATTDPGAYFLRKPINVDGTAILTPGQYLSTYKIGRHRNAYEALVQSGGPVRVWRDDNRDQVLNWQSNLGISGWYGINIHRAKKEGETDEVGRFSAGCQVFQDADDFDVFMTICRRARDKWGNSYSYTLITEDDLDVANANLTDAVRRYFRALDRFRVQPQEPNRPGLNDAEEKLRRLVA
jgi:hypothetical protein